MPRLFNRERVVFSINIVGETGCAHIIKKKNEVEPLPYTIYSITLYTKINQND
jgi:hypothetical protein